MAVWHKYLSLLTFINNGKPVGIVLGVMMHTLFVGMCLWAVAVWCLCITLMLLVAAHINDVPQSEMAVFGNTSGQWLQLAFKLAIPATMLVVGSRIGMAIQEHFESNRITEAEGRE